jgi:hypothetical protein
MFAAQASPRDDTPPVVRGTARDCGNNSWQGRSNPQEENL